MTRDKPRPLKAVPRRDSRGRSRTLATRSAAGGARLARTVLLGIIALGAGLWYLTDTFGVDRGEWLGFGLTALVAVGVLVIAAALVSALIRLIRRR